MSKTFCLFYEKQVNMANKWHYLFTDKGAKGQPGEPAAAAVMSAMAIQAAIQEVDLGKCSETSFTATKENTKSSGKMFMPYIDAN